VIPLTDSSEQSDVVRRVSFRREELEEVCKEATRSRYLVQVQPPLLVDQQLQEASPTQSTSTSTSTITAHTAPALQSPAKEDDENDTVICKRGLELTHDRSRQRRKYIILRSIVKNQHELTPQQLAKLAQICTAWAKDAATVQGRIDYCNAYNASFATGTSSNSNEPGMMLPSMDRYPLPFKAKTNGKKRCVDTNSIQQQQQQQIRPTNSVKRTRIR